MTRRPAASLSALGIFTLTAWAVGAGPAGAAELAPVDVPFAVADVASDGFTTWTVPTNICAIDVTAAGGNGGTATERPGATRGRGAIIATRTAVAPGDVLTVAVGARGVDGRPGGAPGGGTAQFEGGGGGGGWSGLATDAVPSQANVIIVAGGGGAAGNWMTGHGGDAGLDAPDVYYEWGPATVGGGKAGTETQGGAGGVGALSGSAGSALAGGAAASTGGGGGAGYFGGGGGTVYYVQSGGGGGSSFPFASSSDRLSYSIKQVSDPEDGWVTISFDPRSDADTCLTPVTDALGPDDQLLEGQTVLPGDDIALSGHDWPRGEVLMVTIEPLGTELGGVTVADDETFSFAGHIPSDIADGEYQLVLTPVSSTLATLTYSFAVSSAAEPGSEPPALAATGGNSAAVSDVMSGAAALFALGLSLLGWAMRRHTRMPNPRAHE